MPRAVQAANKLINNDKIFLMVGALGTPMNNAVLGEQLQKGVPNLFPFTAARSMAEPCHKLKFAPVLHLLRSGARIDQALRREGGEEEGLRDVPGHGFRPRDP